MPRTYLQPLQNLLCQNDLLDKSQQLRDAQKYTSIQEGLDFKANDFFSEELSISVCLNIDDFEVCNPSWDIK